MTMLTGNIIEKWSSRPVANAIVSFVVPGRVDAAAVRETGIDGYFAADLGSGWYDIIVSAPNYEDARVRINLFADTHQNIILSPVVRAL